MLSTDTYDSSFRFHSTVTGVYPLPSVLIVPSGIIANNPATGLAGYTKGRRLAPPGPPAKYIYIFFEASVKSLDH